MADTVNSAVSLTALFLQQSLLDSETDYKRMLSSPSAPHWDAVIITASNASQARGYEAQLEYRRKAGRLPANTDFLVVPDRNGKRVGSGGAALNVLSLLRKRYGSFNGRRFLLIGAGGDSRRCPQLSAVGKLFSPVPTAFDTVPATLFDMFMVTMASLPGRMHEGMFLLSGDVILLFNPLMCDFGSAPASIITFKEDVQTGKDHGVCLKNDKSGCVRKFLHKQSVETLTAQGAVDERGNCNIDTGAIHLSPEIMDRLYTLVDTPDKMDAFVNDRVRLSLYGDIAYTLSESSTLESLLREAPEGEFCDELARAREALFGAIGTYAMKCLTISPARFIHFGSIPEIMQLMDRGVWEYERLGWKKQINSSVPGDTAAYNSVLSSGASIGSGCYLEVSYVHSRATVGKNCLLSFIDIHDEVIPDSVLLHGLKQNNGRFVCRIMDIRDNPKTGCFFGEPLETLRKRLNVASDALWDAGDAPILWNAKLFPECATIREAVASALNLYALAHGAGDREAFVNASRKSLRSGFEDADPQAIIDWNSRMEELVRMDRIKELILSRAPARIAGDILKSSSLTPIQSGWLRHEVEQLDTDTPEGYSYAIRLYYYLGTALGDETYTAECFKVIRDTVLRSALSHLSYNADARIAHDETVVRLPLRVNWGGGWTDTCPYCVENGGVVLNAAITLRGKYPVEVRLKRISEKKIVFDSRDMDVHGEFDTLAPLQQTGDPFDSFALQKACLLACGILPEKGGDLGDILDRLGGGFEMHSEVTDVPKGSGLGTSSILAAASVKAVFEFMDLPCDDDTLYATVLAMEQLMSTGGGWQDQVGGVTPGIKFITSVPGIRQQLKVEQVRISEKTRQELNSRFAIIYTGQRRLARNLLRDVVGRYVGSEEDSLLAHREIQKSAALMRFALEREDVDEFARLLNAHWALSKMIDQGSTNTLIDHIFMSVDDLIDARMVCGAGGGGFLQVVLKKNVTKEQLHERLKEVFQDFAVDVWPSEIVYK